MNYLQCTCPLLTDLFMSLTINLCKIAPESLDGGILLTIRAYNRPGTMM